MPYGLYACYTTDLLMYKCFMLSRRKGHFLTKIYFNTVMKTIVYNVQFQWPMIMCMFAKSLQSCPTLFDPMDCSPPGSSVHRVLQARALEWAAVASSRGSS